MRTQSRHSIAHSGGTCNLVVAMLILESCLVPVQIANAGPVGDRLDQYIGHEPGVVIGAFGPPDTRLTNLLSYSFNAERNPIDPSSHHRFGPISPPNSANTHGLITPDSSGSSSALLPCFIDFQLGVDSTVENVIYRGPGCFEVVLSRTIPKK